METRHLAVERELSTVSISSYDVTELSTVKMELTRANISPVVT